MIETTSSPSVSLDAAPARCEALRRARPSQHRPAALQQARPIRRRTGGRLREAEAGRDVTHPPVERDGEPAGDPAQAAFCRPPGACTAEGSTLARAGR
ncbi:hypothetical protein [Streptomyces mexicanus]|uniref:hypothetical protein n=1 Tax=Streptomyces mexicanus TaxID=178566 RepID=UPI00368DBD08